MPTDALYRQIRSLGAQSGSSSSLATEYKLRVEDLSPSVTEERLRAIFSPHGMVIRVNIFEDRKWLKGLNYAFVSFSYQADIPKAIKLCNGLYLDGSKIKVSAARAETNPNTAENSPSGGFGTDLVSTPKPSIPVVLHPAFDSVGPGTQYNFQSYTSSFHSYSVRQEVSESSQFDGPYPSIPSNAMNQGGTHSPGKQVSIHRPSTIEPPQEYSHGNGIHSRIAHSSRVSTAATLRRRGADSVVPVVLADVEEEVSTSRWKASLLPLTSYGALTSYCQRFLGFKAKGPNSRGSPSKGPSSQREKEDTIVLKSPLPVLQGEVTFRVERSFELSITSRDAPKYEEVTRILSPAAYSQDQAKKPQATEDHTAPDKSLPSPTFLPHAEAQKNGDSSVSLATQDTEPSERSHLFSLVSPVSRYSTPYVQEERTFGPQQGLIGSNPFPSLYTKEVTDVTGQVTKSSETPSFEGIYSFVYPGHYRDRLVAIKVLRAVGTVSAMKRKIRREMQTWSALNEHPNILPLYGFHEEFGAFGAMISPWCKYGNSSDYLRTRWLPPANRVQLLLQVASVVAFLHAYDPQIVHGDLKPTNILIDDDGNARVCDFGLARLISEYGSTGLTTTTAYTGTVRYLSYELVESDDTKLPSPASDVHALACVGFAFLYLNVPYANRQGHQLTYIVRDIMKGIPPATRPEGNNNPTIALLWHLFEECWSLEPTERPRASAVVDFLTLHGKDLAVALTIPF